MIHARLAEAAAWLEVSPPQTDVTFRGVCIDSRRVQPGNLFVALVGAHHDGHDFAAEARERGAVAGLVERAVSVDLPQLLVPDVVAALGSLARAWRRQFDPPVIAVAGSNGKTTVNGMLASILAQASGGRVLATEGNLNNHIGLPLTLLRLDPTHCYAAIELGADHPGEIAYLAEIAGPTLALITNAGFDHLAGFGGPEGVARANAELLTTMAPGGVAVLNADDPCCGIWEEFAIGHRTVRFGLHAQAEVRGRWKATAAGGRLEAASPWGEIGVDVPLLGEHNGANALAAAAAALAIGVAPAEISAGLAAVRAVNGRLRMLPGANGVRVIDDSYNANPSSLAAALDVMAELEGEKVLVLGDMDDLGDAAADWHVRAGQSARDAGIDWLYAVGGRSQHAVRAFGPGGQHYGSKQELMTALHPCLHAEMIVLVKGSRCMGMEDVVAGLTESGDGEK